RNLLFVKYVAFWESTDEPSLNEFLNFRSRAGDLEDEVTEHNRDLIVSSASLHRLLFGLRVRKGKTACLSENCVLISRCTFWTTLRTVCLQGKDCVFVWEKTACLKERLRVCPGKLCACNDKNSKRVNYFWELQMKRQNIQMEIKLLEEKNELLEKELSHQIALEQTRHILDATRETRNQGALLQSEVTTKIKKRMLDKSDAPCEQPKRRVKATNRVNRVESAEHYSKSYDPEECKEECINVEQDEEIISDEQNVSNEIDEGDETEFESLNSSPPLSEGDNGSVYTPSDIEDQNPPPPLIPSQLKDFHKYFTDMSKAHKWVLTSGKCIEDTLFEHCKELPNESLLHSWIIDLDDREAEELFTIEEWKEIQRETRKFPEVDETFVESMMRFADVETESELRKVLETTSFRNEDEPYVQEDHFDAEWAETVMRKFLMYYENHNEPLKRSHLESWYDINVWSHIVDHGLSDIFGIEVVRKESTSDAVSTRKNRKRICTRYKKLPRKKMGYKMDGLFRTYLNNIEYGAIEVGKKFDETKLLADGFKISKAMHDIFVCLCRLVNFEETKIRKLQIPGILHLGLKSQVLQMSSPKGYVTILKRDKLLEVPATIEKIKDLIRVLVSIWKKMIKDNMKIVFTVQNPNDFKQELLGEESPDGIDVPWSLDSIV
ncbi:7436_t:CDS:10, partial [Cetraspora pellucida]